MLPLLLSAFLLSPFAASQDSTLIYTLKPNETMVQLGEHTFLHTSKGPEYVFATFIRKQGYFIRTSDKRNFGPFETINSRYFYDGLWWVGEKGGLYLLDVYSGKKFGPFNGPNVDTWRFSRTHFLAVETTTFRDSLYLNLTGKMLRIGYHKDSAAFYADVERRDDGRWLAKYTVVHSQSQETLKQDSILVYSESEGGPSFTVKSGNNKKQTGKCQMDSLFMNKAFYSMVQNGSISANNYSFEHGYEIDQDNGDVYHTECSGDSLLIFRNKKKVISFPRNKYYTITIQNGKLLFDNDYFLEKSNTMLDRKEYFNTFFSRGEKYYAHEQDAIVYINDVAKAKGYNLTYFQKGNSFKWITIHGRSLYQVTFACND